MDENETNNETNVDEETDFGPFAVAAVALVTVGAAGVVVGRNYNRAKDAVKDRLAVRKARQELAVVEDITPEEDD